MLSHTNSNTSQSPQLSPTKSLTSQPKMLSHTNSTTSQSPQLSPTKSFTSQPKMLSHANSNTSQFPQLSPTTSLTSQQKMLSHPISNTSQSKMLSPTNINSSQSPQLSHTTSNTSQPERLSPIKLNSPQSQQLSPPIPTTSQNCTVNNNNGDKPCYQINSLNKKISLPHVYLKTSHTDEKLCFLIDTGASVSLVKHARLQKPPPIDGSVIHIKGINSSENYSETLGSLQLHIEHPFPNNTKLSFDYKFHAVLSDINLDCDGIIGNDLLQSLDADVQYSTNTLLIQGYYLPIHFTQPVYIIPSRSIAIVECAVSNDESELSNCKVALIVDHTVSEGVYVSNCLATLKSNKRVNVSILNTTESDVKIIDYRVHLTPIDFNLEDAESTSESINKITLSNSSRSQQVLNNIRTSHLNEQEKKALLNCCSEFTDIFYLEGEPLSYTSAIKHSINTGDSPPIHVKSYRFPECHKEEVGKQIQKMLDQNIIIPSNSPWSAPVWVVPKKLDASGKRKWRVVIDYRKLNDVTVSEVYPLPLINDILDQLGHSKYFSTLDLASGFHQIAMDPQDADKTGFSVITNGSTSGHYQFTRMPFGLKNAPSTFQRLMNTALSGLQGLHCLVFLDDVIIYSHDLESHIQKLNLVFDKLRHFNLKLQPDKCEFLRREVAYLGHVITDKGVSPNPEKVKAVSEFPVPKNPKDVKSFLGLAGYYRRFIENFSKITKPLTSLLKKDACFHWSQEQQEAFNLLKDKLTSAPLLQYPNFEIPFVLTTDASNYAVSAILSQGDIGKDKPIAYASRTLNKQEGNYSTTEKELLAIIFGVNNFRPYLYGRKFKIVTDHKPLIWLFNVKDPGSRLVRWRLKLEEYDYEIVYKQGRLNSNADTLSRYPVCVLNQNLNETTYETYLKLQFTKSNSNNTTIEEHSERLLTSKYKLIACPTSLDFDYSMPHCYEILSDLEKADELLSAEREVPSVQSVQSKNRTYYLLYTKVHHYDETNYKTIYELLTKLRDKVLKENQTETDLAISDFTEPFTKLAYTKIYNMISYIFHNTNITIHVYKNQLIYPTPPEVPKILSENHGTPIAGHPGIKRMFNRIKSAYYWKTMRTDIENFVKNCKLCQINKPLRSKNKAPMEITSSSTKPFERIALDFVGPLPESGPEKFRFILTLQDDLTKFSTAYPLASSTSEDVARSLIHFMSLFGFPKSVLTDLGTSFTSELFRQVTEICKIKSLFTTPYHPQTNGALERSHATLKEYLKSFVNDNHDDWHCYLFTAILAYNTTPHTTTQYTPYELLYGYKPSIPSSLYETTSNTTYHEYIRALQYRMRFSRQKALENIILSKENSKKQYDKTSSRVTYKTGDLVYVKHHHRLRKALSPVWKGPYKIIKMNGNYNVTLLIGRKHIKYHVNEIKPAHP